MMMNVRMKIAGMLLTVSVLLAGSLFLSIPAFVNEHLTPKWYGAVFGTATLTALVVLSSCFTKNRPSGKPLIPMVMTVISVLCALQAGYGILQYAGLFTGNNGFRVSGSFDNPAGLAASLCAGFPACLYFIRERQQAWLWYGAIVSGGIIACAVILSQSRAGVMSILVVTSVWGLLQLKTKIKPWHLFASGTLLCLLMAGLYLLKKDSADGRLLIWACCWEMIKDKPLLGQGHGGFHARYMDYQAYYFRLHPDSQFAMLADNTGSPFNEYLLLAVEHGLLGCLLLVTLLLFVWKTYRKKRTHEARIGVLILLAVGIVAFFSYPLTYPFPWIMMAGGILLLSGRVRFNKSLVAGGAVAIACLVLVAFTLRDCLLQIEWYKTAQASLRKQSRETFARYEELYPRLDKRRLFLYNYTAELNYAGQYEKSLEIGKVCRQFWADYDLQLLLADNYLNIQDYEQAEICYRQASYMCPNRFMPLYKLAQLYEATGRQREAVALAEKIIVKEVKIDSPTIRSIQYYMRQLINDKINNAQNDKRRQDKFSERMAPETVLPP